MKHLKTALAAVYIVLIFIGFSEFRYHSMNTWILYASIYACSLICFGFKLGPWSAAAVLAVSALAFYYDGAFAFMYFPIFSDFSALKAMRELPDYRSKKLYAAVFTGFSLTSLAALIYRSYFLAQSRRFFYNDANLRYGMGKIIIFGIAASALLVIIVSALDKKGVSSPLAEKLLLARLNLDPAEGKGRRRVPINLSDLLNSAIIALTCFYFSATSFSGVRSGLCVAGWIVDFILVLSLRFDKQPFKKAGEYIYSKL